MDKPILYYWGPCPTCALVTAFAEEHGIELDKRDIEQEQPYNELLALGGIGDNIPYLYASEQLVQGVEACNAFLQEHYM